MSGELGKAYEAGEVIVRQGDVGHCMYVVQAGRVEVLRDENGKETRLATLEPGDIFGEMAIFERQKRSATVRAVEESRVLTVDKRTLMRRIQSDPLLALNLLETMSQRIRTLDREVVRLEEQLRAGDGDGRV